MGESSHTQHQRSRLGLRNTGGEIVEVQGGHIVRSTGRKDRHSKVCTAKGPRDRRVRLAAHTAIQFYDVQDRLGYDRPSKAVDWLIKKAKSAIDELAELPAWHPTNCLEGGEIVAKKDEEDGNHHNQQQEEEQQQQQQLIAHHTDTNPQNSSFLPPALDSDAIANTIKSFFPMGASAEASSTSMPQFQSFQSSNLLSRNNSHTNSQDLRLSLQSLQDPLMLQHNSHPQQQQQQQQTPVLLSGTPLGFDGSTPWPEHHHFQRLASWNSGGDAASGSGGGAASGYLFNSTPPQLLGHSHNHNQFFSQRGPLQSSNTPSVRAWIDPSAVAAMADHGHHHHHHHLHSPPMPIYPSSISGIGFGGFPGFQIPTRIQGDEEEHDGYSDKPSSASSDSRR